MPLFLIAIISGNKLSSENSYHYIKCKNSCDMTYKYLLRNDKINIVTDYKYAYMSCMQEEKR
jgi:hypothetical protein